MSEGPGSTKRARLEGPINPSAEPESSSSSSSSSSRRVIPVQPHHIRQQHCHTRSEYRRSRLPTAVKVYTIADESTYLLVQNVPKLNGVDVGADLHALCRHYGQLEIFESVEYEAAATASSFTETYLIKYTRLHSAIQAKKRLDDYVLLGSPLHLCYAPELEQPDETWHKLCTHLQYVSKKWTQQQCSTNNRLINVNFNDNDGDDNEDHGEDDEDNKNTIT